MSLASEACKWSRNLTEDNQNESNRLRLIEKQRKILESKRNKHQQIIITSSSLKPARELRPLSAINTLNDKLIDFNPELQLKPPLVLANASTAVLSNEPSQNISEEKPNSFSNINKCDSEVTKKSKICRSQINEKLDYNKDANEIESIKDLEIVTPCPILNPLQSILNNSQLLVFATQPVPPNQTYQCTIIRDKRGIDRTLYPTYYIHLQAIVNKQQLEEAKDESNNFTSQTEKKCMANRIVDKNSFSAEQLVKKHQVFLLSGRRRKKSKTYLISNDPFDITRNNCIAKLKSNVLGTQFHAIRTFTDGQRYEIVAIVYETNVLGFKGPRKMSVIVPKNDQMDRFPNSSLHEMWKNDLSHKSLIFLKNKTPVWNEDTQSYVLNFHGRVTQASVKNFQLVYVSQDDESFSDFVIKDDLSIQSNVSRNLTGNIKSTSLSTVKSIKTSIEDEISMQFGRVSDKMFTCDVTWPLSILQAFCIALSSFDSKLACE